MLNVCSHQDPCSAYYIRCSIQIGGMRIYAVCRAFHSSSLLSVLFLMPMHFIHFHLRATVAFYSEEPFTIFCDVIALENFSQFEDL